MPAERSDWGYFDTSALVKAYVEERGTAQALALLARYSLISSAIAPIELIGALRRRCSEGDLSAEQTNALLARINMERSHWTLVNVDGQVLALAELLCRNEPVRTLDSLHIASALTLTEASGFQVPFITADARQRETAARRGLDVMWIE